MESIFYAGVDSYNDFLTGRRKLVADKMRGIVTHFDNFGDDFMLNNDQYLLKYLKQFQSIMAFVCALGSPEVERLLNIQSINFIL